MRLKLLYGLVLTCTLAIAGAGVDFSPSFTAMFLMAFLALTALGELCALMGTAKPKYGRVFAASRRLLGIVGALFVIPSVLIYAAGDDWMIPCVRIALIASIPLHIAVYALLYRRNGKTLSFGAGLENLLLLAVTVLTLACAVPSPGLWPYGAGLALLLIAKRLEDVREDLALPRAATALGMLLCSVFLAAPMVF